MSLKTAGETSTSPHCLVFDKYSQVPAAGRKWGKHSGCKGNDTRPLPQKSLKVKEETDAMAQPRNREAMSPARLTVHPAIRGRLEAACYQPQGTHHHESFADTSYFLPQVSRL